MKNIILLLCLFLAINVQGQKDMAMILESPAAGLQLQANEAMPVKFAIKNNSTVTLLPQDSIIIAFYMNGTALSFSGNIFFLIDHPSKAPGDTIQRTIPITFGITPAPSSVFCVRVFIFNGGNIDNNPSNDVACETINVGLNDPFMVTPGLKAFPNPASNHISFETPAFEGGVITVRDITGKVLGEMSVTETETRLETAEWARGIYFYELRNRERIIQASGRFSLID